LSLACPEFVEQPALSEVEGIEMRQNKASYIAINA
jgi:hypothetical protein